MLFLLIPAAWLAVMFLALTMCRLAALSDDSRAVALAERIVVSYLAEHRDVFADSPVAQLRLDAQLRAQRAILASYPQR